MELRQTQQDSFVIFVVVVILAMVLSCGYSWLFGDALVAEGSSVCGR